MCNNCIFIHSARVKWNKMFTALSCLMRVQILKNAVLPSAFDSCTKQTRTVMTKHKKRELSIWIHKWHDKEVVSPCVFFPRTSNCYWMTYIKKYIHCVKKQNNFKLLISQPPQFFTSLLSTSLSLLWTTTPPFSTSSEAQHHIWYVTYCMCQQSAISFMEPFTVPLSCGNSWQFARYHFNI